MSSTNKNSFSDALERAKQIAAKINVNDDKSTKRSADEDYSNEDYLESKRSAAELNDPIGAQLAAMKNKSGFSAKGPMVSHQYTVPDKLVGLVIGKGGENITKIQSETGAIGVQFEQDSGGLPCRKYTITGPPESIYKAKAYIDDIVYKAADKANNVELPSPGSDSITASVAIPADRVGLIIGQKGANIIKLQEDSNTRMIMIQDGIYATAPEKELRITGGPSHIQKAKELVAELLAQHGYVGSSDLSAAMSREILVPKYAVGLVVGKGGETIKKLMSDYGVRIRFKDGDSSLQGVDRVLVITGDIGNIDAVFKAISSYISTAEAKNGIQPSHTQQEMHLMIPSTKVGVIIGKAGEAVRAIGHQTGAHVEFDRAYNVDNSAPNKAFRVRGTIHQIQEACRLICEKAEIPMPALNFPMLQNQNQYGNYQGYVQPQSMYAGSMYQQNVGYAPQGWANAYSQQNVASYPSQSKQQVMDPALAQYYAQFYSPQQQNSASPSNPTANSSNTHDTSRSSIQSQASDSQYLNQNQYMMSSIPSQSAPNAYQGGDSESNNQMHNMQANQWPEYYKNQVAAYSAQNMAAANSSTTNQMEYNQALQNYYAQLNYGNLSSVSSPQNGSLPPQ